MSENNNQSRSKDDSFSTSDDLEDNYYSILNIARDASDREITQAYHRFGLIYHPDKQKDIESKRNAEMLFAKIKKAYDVLIDPYKRAIYDSVGVKGLQQNDLQLVVRSKTPQEIREEYERLSREREERRLEKLTQSQGHFSMTINAVNIFDSTTSTNKATSDQALRIGHFGMEQSIDFPISNKDTVTLSGSLSTSDQYGQGSVSATLRRFISSDTYLDFKGTLGANRSFSVMGFKQLTNKCNGSLNALFRYKNGSFDPILKGTLNYQLGTNWIGQLHYKTSFGENASMSTALIYEKDQLQANLRFQLSVKNTFISVAVNRKFMDDKLKLKSSLQFGYLGATFTYGVEKQVTQFTRLDASMIINSVAGVVLNLECHRGSQTFMIPILLSQEVLPSAIFYGTVAPVAVYYVIKRMIIDPYLKQTEEEEGKRKQEKLRAEIEEKRRLALAAQHLMKESVQRIVEKEGESGLIIKKAFYGKIDENSIESSLQNEEKVIDVRIPLQFLVKDHGLQIISDQTKSNLEGFYDPCIGESKSLYIEYEFKNEQYKALIADNELVRLPKSTHKVQWWTRTFNSVKKVYNNNNK